MKAGIPLNKVDICRELLEENAYRLCDSSHLYELIPFIHKQEQSSIQNQIRGRKISVIFDGTTHVCEALAIIIRFVDDEWNVKQRAVRVMLLAKSLTSEEVAHQLIVCLSTEYGIGSNLLQAAMRDRASVNSVAMRTLSIVFPNSLDIGYFSHTLDHVGEHFNTPALDAFMKVWISMFSRSPKSKLAWTTKTGLSIPLYLVIRW